MAANAFILDTGYTTIMSRAHSTTTDRRARRTRQALRAALMALIAEQGYEAVSVQQIAERADVGRATFYLHYPDKEHLLHDSIEAVFEELRGQLAALDGAGMEARALQMVEQTFAHVAAHAGFYRALLSAQGVALIATRVRDLAAGFVEGEIRAALPPGAQPATPIALLAQHTAGAMLAQLEWWLSQGSPGSPAAMAALHWRLVTRGMLAELGR